MFLQDHCYSTFKWQVEHPYACSGLMWEKDLDHIQDELLKYVLDKNRPSEELIIKQGQICLTREDFWSLGLSQCMESNIGNACLKIVEEAARRHGKNVHIVDLYAVPTWKDKNVDPEHSLPENVRSKDIVLFPAWSRQADEADHYLLCALFVAKREIVFLDSLRPDGFGDETYRTIFRHIATFIDQGSWTEKTGRDLECFPQQSTGNSCGIYMLMYALSTCTSWPLTFTEEEVPLIRQWWCIQLMERFCLEGHGQRFAHWAEEASQLLQGTLEPVFRVSNSTTTKQTPSRRVVVEEDTDKVQQPTTVRDLHTAWYWVHNHRDLFRGEVTEPAFLQMNSEDQQNALKKALESEF
ncbi:sentrin-specific protease 1-like [Onychostoma macrolepis]|uniref:sentrin-specific protease 1-like n=1 Tax=Onychostoma macrolepis TaxID=369639 RepID=UPI00272A480B|nr:sentrin-specific protease 1-like [Onychostoma macrolepis]